MASAVDICNLALSRLGDTATVSSIDPPEGSVQAEHCARFYPVSRDSLLEAYDWKFSTRWGTIARLDLSHPGWRIVYAVPNDMIRVIAVLPPGAVPGAASVNYAVETSAKGDLVILSNQDKASIHYTTRVTDTSKFSPLFVDALAWLLASNLAGPLIKGDAGAKMGQSCYQFAQATISQAKVSDANQPHDRQDHVPAWIKAR
ncbi:MAG: hypothetical protein LBJ59_12230 [Zoogloeaceae bacterium]|jgi:hypothetical protein|nr:hypothetical protein [Zoogloeaceae bacterium]